MHRLGYDSLIHGLIFKRAFGMGLEVSNALEAMYVKWSICLEQKKYLMSFHFQRRRLRSCFSIRKAQAHILPVPVLELLIIGDGF
ncbi:unnamed protein product [Dovyalis caffra]|uniref:Uncharacterized protein n=1 Tax=Dovyalis caffra TaxID=77055 RepID=A0AAV1RKX1_9ROSI|nr:unnamed protein product [Dovyalis caffra]